MQLPLEVCSPFVRLIFPRPMATPPVPTSSTVSSMESAPQPALGLHPAPPTVSTQQSVDALLALPPNRLRQTLQLAQNRAGLDEAEYRTSSSGVTAVVLLHEGLSDTVPGEYRTRTSSGVAWARQSGDNM